MSGKLNCKPGDLAVVVGSNCFAGMVVEVLHEAPVVRFNLPDGHHHSGCRPGYWVLKLPRKVPAVVGGQIIPRMAEYGCVPDSKLRPLRDDDGVDEMILRVGIPGEVQA